MELASLKDVLLWVVYGGAGVVAQAIMEWLVSSVVAAKVAAKLGIVPVGEWLGEYKRYLSFALDVLLAWGCLSLAYVFGYMEAPVGWVAWMETLFAVAFLLVIVQQGVHARRFLR